MIGLEIHVQLNTSSKLFCGCPTRGKEPNSAVCEVCLGMPGAKPVLNKKALDFAIMVATALKCEVNREFFFSRKTYFYPDLAKNFQITQYEVPIGENGSAEVDGKKVRIRRVHLEEDPASLVHEFGVGSSSYSLVDYNRSGVPLAEIVTEPDMESPEQARKFMDSLLKTLNYLGIYSYTDGVLKADCNLSVAGGERVEVKNVTGFRAIEQVPELADEKAVRFVKEFGLKEYDAKVLSADKGLAGVFEDAAKIDSAIAARIVSRELFGVLNFNKIALSQTKITGRGISGLVKLVKEGRVSERNAKQSLIKYALEGTKPEEFLKKSRMLIDSSSLDIEGVVSKVVKENRKAFDDYKKGNEKALNFLSGLVMRETKGRADARQVIELLKKHK